MASRATPRLVPFALASLLALPSCMREDAAAPGGNLSAGITSGTDYYVAPTGNDASLTCSATDPCKTMVRVSQLLHPGDVAHFAAGNYSWSAQRVNVSGTAVARITYISDTPGGAKIITNASASTGCFIMANEGKHVDIIGFDLTVGLTGDCATGVNGLIQDGDSGRIIGNRVHAVPGDTRWGGGGIIVECNCDSDTTRGNEVIGNVVDSIGPFVLGQSQSNIIHGIYLAGPENTAVNNIVSRAAAACIEVYHATTRLMISNNVVVNCGRYGIEIGAETGTTNDNTIVANNIVGNVGTPTPGQYSFGIRESFNNGCNNRYYNNIVFNNRVNFDRATCTQTAADSNITYTSDQSNALFVRYTGDANGDYHLRSEGIDEGTTRCAPLGVSPCAPATDFSGVSRPQGSAYDIGAYETAITPVLSWSFDEGSGQTASDGSGNNNTATLGTTTAVEPGIDPAWTLGKVGAALVFDGNASRATTAGSPTINNLSAFTYVAWIYITGQGVNDYGRVFSKESAAGFDEFDVIGHYRLEGSVYNTETPPQQFRARNDTLLYNTWYHAAVTYDDKGDRLLHVYLNGSEVTYYPGDPRNPVTGTLSATSNALITGNRIAGDRGFQGKIDEVRIYNRALSARKVAELAGP